MGSSLERVCSNPCRYTAGSKLLTISGCFASNVTGVEFAVVTITNLKNPSPARTTGNYYGTIGIDKTTAGTTSIATFDPGQSSCIVTFDPNYLNRTNSKMVATITPKNPIPATGGVKIDFPAQNRWTGELSSRAFGITSSSMACETSAGGVISCTGDLDNRRISASTVFGGITSTSFTVGINNILSPPSPTNTDKITITTTDGTYSIDYCQVSVTGLQANPLTATITTDTPATVNSATTLNFGLLISDTVTNTKNTYQLIFPSGSSFSSTPSVSSYLIPSSFSLSGTTASWTFADTYTILSGGTVSFSFDYLNAPTSTLPISITVNVLSSGTIVQTGVATFAAIESELSYTVNNNPKTVNLASQYTFVITLTDRLSSTGMIDIKFPSTITFNNPTVVSISGTGVSMASISLTDQADHTLRLASFATTTVGGSSNPITVVIGGLINPPSTAPS